MGILLARWLVAHVQTICDWKRGQPQHAAELMGRGLLEPCRPPTARTRHCSSAPPVRAVRRWTTSRALPVCVTYPPHRISRLPTPVRAAPRTTASARWAMAGNVHMAAAPHTPAWRELLSACRFEIAAAPAGAPAALNSAPLRMRIALASADVLLQGPEPGPVRCW